MGAWTSERARFFGLLLCAACALFGCGDDGAGRFGGKAQRGDAKVGGAVVSTVNGHPITLSDVEALMRASGSGEQLTAREALERLQAEQLLMAEAERRGIAGGAIDQVAERARVQALLDAEAAANVATEAELRAAYENDLRFHVPEMRKSIHVLARANEQATDEQVKAAFAVAQKAVADLRTLTPAEILARYTGKIDGVTVKSEELPPVHRGSAFVKEYLTGLFSIPEVGVVPEPVRTRFGWHAIRVTEISPPEETSYEDALKTLRSELTTKKQTDAMKALLLDLRHAHPVTIVPDANDKLSLVDGAETFRSR